MHDQECWHSTSSTGVGRGGGSYDNRAVALMLAAAAAARECSSGVGSISMSVQEAAADAEADHRKQSRVERKRTKRRFDTSSQFTALAELVKEIEATDLAEEALFDVNKRYDNHGQEEEEVEEQQHLHQNQIDERVGPNNSNENGNDGHDASVTVSSVASGEKPPSLSSPPPSLNATIKSASFIIFITSDATITSLSLPPPLMQQSNLPRIEQATTHQDRSIQYADEYLFLIRAQHCSLLEQILTLILSLSLQRKHHII